MLSPPPCDSMGSHCRELRLTLRIAELNDDGPQFHDAIATWLLGHREQITFGEPYTRGTRLLVDVTAHVPCRYLATEEAPRATGGRRQAAGNGPTTARCRAHGMRDHVPPSTRSAVPVQHGANRFSIVQDREIRALTLTSPEPPRRALPTLAGENPCAGAPCRTADNRRGAACCRDLTLDVVVPESDIATEALVRSRKSPYLCKVTRVDTDLLECEVISACGYLDPADLGCTLHGLTRENGSPAKPSICSDWPSNEPDSTYHPGCRLVPARTAPALGA